MFVSSWNPKTGKIYQTLENFEFQQAVGWYVRSAAVVARVAANLFFMNNPENSKSLI